ncbi:unnamed protein product [Scytosiphon promiscuus]
MVGVWTLWREAPLCRYRRCGSVFFVCLTAPSLEGLAVQANCSVGVSCGRIRARYCFEPRAVSALFPLLDRFPTLVRAADLVSAGRKGQDAECCPTLTTTISGLLRICTLSMLFTPTKIISKNHGARPRLQCFSTFYIQQSAFLHLHLHSTWYIFIIATTLMSRRT